MYRLVPLLLAAACTASSSPVFEPDHPVRPGAVSPDFSEPVQMQDFGPAAPRWRARSATWEAGVSRVAANQNVDGGWPWPLTGATSAYNTAGPIAMGLLAGSDVADDPSLLPDVEAAGDFLLGKTWFTGLDGVLAAAVFDRFGDDAALIKVRDDFYGAISAGTYVHRDGYNPTDTADYIQHIRDARDSRGFANLAAWDIGVHYVGAVSVGGADADIWLDGVKDAIEAIVIDDQTTNGIDHSYGDVLGLAGAVWALGTAREEFDPAAGAYASADTTEELLSTLMFLQIEESGGWPWSANLSFANANHESVQASAYAMLAAFTFRETAAIQGARGWLYLVQSQLPSGGWEDYGGSGENNELSGEAMWAAAEHQATARIRIEAEQTAFVIPDPCGGVDEADISAVLYDLSSRTRGIASFRFDLLTDLGTDASTWGSSVVDFGPITNRSSDGTAIDDDLTELFVAQDPSSSPRALNEGRFADRPLADVTLTLPSTPGSYSVEVADERVLVFNRLRSGQLLPRTHEAVVHPDRATVLRVSATKGDSNSNGLLDIEDADAFAACEGLLTADCLALFDADCDADVDADDASAIGLP